MAPQTPTIPTWTQAAMDATKAMVANEVTLLNNNLVAQFNQGFDNWAQAVMNGTIPNTNPPQPPTGYAAMMGDDGWAYIAKCASPVCAMPPIPAVPQPAQTPTGVFIPAIGQSIDPPVGAPSYPDGQVFSFLTATGTVYFIAETVGNPFSPTLTKNIWTRVAAPATS